MSTLLKLLGERDYDNDDTRFTVVLPWREWRNTKNDLAELAALRESVTRLKERNDELEQREIGYNAEIERRDLAMAEQARQLSEARRLLTTLDWNDWCDEVDAWLSATAPAPRCTCGMGDATAPEYHAADCALTAPAPQDAQDQGE